MLRLVKNNKGVYFVDGLDNVKTGVVGKEANFVDYSDTNEKARQKEKELLENITSVEQKKIIMLNQVHGDEIAEINSVPEKNLLFYADADAMITKLRGMCLVIRTADCVPVFACDQKRSVFGAAHSGWRGTKLSISKKLVELMLNEYGSEAEDIKIFIFPSIGPESYIVNEDVAQYFQDDVVIENNNIFLNLWKNITRSLIAAGIPEDNIFNPELCTLKESHRFFSYRNSDLGRNLNFLSAI